MMRSAERDYRHTDHWLFDQLISLRMNGPGISFIWLFRSLAAIYVESCLVGLRMSHVARGINDINYNHSLP